MHVQLGTFTVLLWADSLVLRTRHRQLGGYNQADTTLHFYPWYEQLLSFCSDNLVLTNRQTIWYLKLCNNNTVLNNQAHIFNLQGKLVLMQEKKLLLLSFKTNDSLVLHLMHKQLGTLSRA